MSECVVRMEMPKGCWDCPCVNGEYGYCQADKEERQIGDPNERPSWCPIICSLPDGHGRLVDADKEIDFHINDFERVKTEGTDVYSKAYSLSDLCDGVTYAYDHAHIIVPADTVERSET